MEKASLKNVAIFLGKHLCWILFLRKLRASGLQLYEREAPTQVFSCDYCEIFKYTSFEKHLQTTASVKSL